MLPIIGPPLQSAVLVLASPPEDRLRVMPLTDVMTVGRLGYRFQGDPIRLVDPHASAGQHAVLRRTPGGTVIEDLGSTNTTRLNGTRLSRGGHLLRVGDEVQTGHSLLRFEHTLPGSPWPEGARPLVEEVLASPADDRPRQLLAEWLMQHRDPRGEFIALQLLGTAAASRRADALLSQHALAWAAPLPVPVESWTFERGFVSSVRVRDVAAAERLRMVHPLSAIEPIAWREVHPR